ncbi:MAG: hypothetical protein E4H03_01290 [Myxococcales bacterium]|jgi:hypothetical protein|nr:MAG: hypothetical protein E4H03_01290 [Myxococcales bacterium]
MEDRTKLTIKAGIAACGAAAVLLAGTACADDVERATDDAGLGMATVFANVFYMPVKLGYAAVGGLTGGLGYVVTGGNKDVAQRVWVHSLGGDYVLSREMVAGDEPIEFGGQADPDM